MFTSVGYISLETKVLIEIVRTPGISVGGEMLCENVAEEILRG